MGQPLVNSIRSQAEARDQRGVDERFRNNGYFLSISFGLDLGAFLDSGDY